MESSTINSTVVDESTASDGCAAYPSVTFESITFSDGTTIELDVRDVVVLVGPNNAGKSVALRELQEYVSKSHQPMVVKNAELRSTGTEAMFRRFVNKYASLHQGTNGETARGYNFNFRASGNIETLWPSRRDRYHGMFCVSILTEDRIKDSNPANTIAVLNDAPSHPIHMLYKDPKIELKIGNFFNRAFGKDLILYRAGGSESPLLVGERIELADCETLFSESYCRRLLDSTVPLASQGDGMRSFASVVLHLIAPTTPTILLLDEPEAFLHPPQARLLGEIIATERSPRAQLILATHSPDVLQGLIEVAPEHLRVVRIRREGEINHIKELDKELVNEISIDPLMKYSSVMSGVFHERVIVCESDADCMFYSSVLSLPEVSGSQHPDVLFVHAGGISRMASLAKTMLALDVPVDLVTDIDVLREDRENDTLKPIIQTLGGNWDDIQPLAKSVRRVIEQARPERPAKDVREDIEEALREVQGTGTFPAPTRTDIQRILRDASPWGAAKRAGRGAIPRGQPTQQFDELLKQCRSIGLWIVPVGELESFCKSIGGHGPRWVQKITEELDLDEDEELRDAREFVGELWRSREV